MTGCPLTSPRLQSWAPDVYQRYVDGDDTPEEIATSYDISIAEVHAALAYAFSHPEEMRAIEARNQSVYEEQAANRLVPDETD